MTKKTVLEFSGGWDSTFLLWKLLTETDDEITVVYIDSQFVSKRIVSNVSHIQYVRAQKVVEKLQQIRPFTFKTHFLKKEEITNEIDNKILLFIQYVAPLINDGTYDRLTFAISYEDNHRKIFPHLEYTPIYYAAKRLFDKICTRGEYFVPLLDDTWYSKYTKAYAIKELPENIKNVIASCHNSSFDFAKDSFVDCDVCNNCVLIEKFKEMLDLGLTPDEIVTWRLNKASEYGDGTLMVASPKDIDWLSTEMGKPNSKPKEQIQISIRNAQANANLGLFKDKEKNYEYYNNDIWKGLIYPEK
jgi:tRNA(Ile)-lysidine synthase TilS/MesJ